MNGEPTPQDRIRVFPGGRVDPTQLRKGIYVLPNLITTAGLFAGIYSIIASFQGDYFKAAVAIIAANVFDALDGRVARVTKTTSDFGIQYDSLADLVAFGVAPAILMYCWALAPWRTWGWLAASLYVACGALRLARFNVQFNSAQKRHFIGLPIPAAAEVIASTILLYLFWTDDTSPVSGRSVSVLLLMYCLSGLMVSTVRYFSFKEIHIHRTQPLGVFLGVLILFKLFLAEPQIILFAAFTGFALSGPARWVFVRLRRFFPRRGGRNFKAA